LVSLLILVALLLLVGGCTLVFDTGSVEFDERGLRPDNNGGFLNNNPNNGTNNPNNGTNNPNNGTNNPNNGTNNPNNGTNNPNNGTNNSNNGTNNPTNNGTNNGAVVPGLGATCGAQPLEGCSPGQGAWPGCLAVQCQQELGKSGVCVRNTSLFGYCSPTCSTDADCRGNRNNPFQASLRCVTNEAATGLCLPGSQAACVWDGDCVDGELCKLAMQPTAGGVELRQVCQAPTPQGAATGSYCNEDRDKGQVQRCKNDLCIDDICSALCPSDGGEGAGYCGSPNQSCQSVDLDEDGVITLEMCAPRPCLSPSECFSVGAQQAYCYPAFLTDGGFGGLCRTDNPNASGSAALGEPCGAFGVDPDQSLCASRFCTGYEPTLTCSMMCDSTADCGPEQVCDVSRYRVGESEFYAKVCSYARGSAEECDGQLDCGAGEYCAPYLFGDVTDDGQAVENPRATGLCVTAVSGGVARGAACGESSCSVYGACVSVSGTAWCSNVCTTSLDCPGTFDCYDIEMLPWLDNATDGTSVSLGWCAP